MLVATSLLVALGIFGAVLLGLGLGFDVTAGIIFSLILIFGSLAIAVASKARVKHQGPARCPECGGLLSPHAPLCTHCGARHPFLPQKTGD